MPGPVRCNSSRRQHDGSPSSAAPPPRPTGLRDDPYRSLAAYVRYARGYSKPKAGGRAGGNEQPEFFVEFKWAQVRDRWCAVFVRIPT